MRHIAYELYVTAELERETKKQKDELRDELFRLAKREYDHKDYLLPVKTIEVPKRFWDLTGMSMDEFTQSRFPGWNVEHVEKNITTGDVVFVLKKDADYMPTVLDFDDNVRVAKSITEYSPEIDDKTLYAEFPEIARKILKPVETFELDDSALEQLVHDEPDILAKLQRHLRSKKPSLRATAQRLKDGSE